MSIDKKTHNISTIIVCHDKSVDQYVIAHIASTTEDSVHGETCVRCDSKDIWIIRCANDPFTMLKSAFLPTEGIEIYEEA